MVSPAQGITISANDQPFNMHKSRLDDPVIFEQATTWAKKLFELVPAIQVVLVQFDSWSGNKAGRKTKPGIVKSSQKMMTALRQGDLEAARLHAEHCNGIAWCSDIESLTKILADRICHGSNSWVDDAIYHGVLMVTVFRD